jgi:hypothetical protein
MNRTWLLCPELTVRLDREGLNVTRERIDQLLVRHNTALRVAREAGKPRPTLDDAVISYIAETPTAQKEVSREMQKRASGQGQRDGQGLQRGERRFSGAGPRALRRTP